MEFGSFTALVQGSVSLKIGFSVNSSSITLEICYRNRYLDISLEDFYEKAYAVGERMTR